MGLGGVAGGARRCPLQVHAVCLPAHTNHTACGVEAPLQEAASVCDLWRLEAELLLLQSLLPSGVAVGGASSALLTAWGKKKGKKRT